MARSKPEDLFREGGVKNKTLKLTLPIAPSVNHMYVNTRSGGRRLTSKAEDYIRRSRALINAACDDQRWIKPAKSVWMYADIVVYMPDRRVRDSHNMLKLLLDVMQGIVFENDYYCLPRIQGVEYDPENPRIEVVISAQSKQARTKAIKA